MGLLFRRRPPLMRLAAGAAVGGVAYQAGRRREQQGMTSAPAPAPAANPTAELERLAQLHQSGALTDDEFTAAKARLLGI